MADTSLTWIETKYPYSDIDKTLKAAAAIYSIYMNILQKSWIT